MYVGGVLELCRSSLCQPVYAIKDFFSQVEIVKLAVLYQNRALFGH